MTTGARNLIAAVLAASALAWPGLAYAITDTSIKIVEHGQALDGATVSITRKDGPPPTVVGKTEKDGTARLQYDEKRINEDTIVEVTVKTPDGRVWRRDVWLGLIVDGGILDIAQVPQIASAAAGNAAAGVLSPVANLSIAVSVDSGVYCTYGKGRTIDVPLIPGNSFYVDDNTKKGGQTTDDGGKKDDGGKTTERKPHDPCVDQQGDTIASKNECCNGKIVVRKGATLKTDKQNVMGVPPRISISFEGEKCLDCTWMQFMWREALVTAQGLSEPFALEGDVERDEPARDAAGKPTTVKFKYPLTANSKKPKWQVDAPHYDKKKPPTYSHENECLEKLSCKEDTIFDRPASMLEQIGPLLKATGPFLKANKAKFEKLEIIFHAQAYLICGGQVCARVTWTASWILDTKDNQKLSAVKYDAKNENIECAKEKAPITVDPDQIAALKEQFPDQTVLK